MSDDNTVDFSAYAKKSGVRDPAKEIASFRGVFPSSWQAVCRDVLVAFKDAKMNELGYKRLGWTAIRDLIMEDFDARAGSVEVGRDSRLKRQDLEFWAEGSDLGPDKFWFVDRFVNKLRLDHQADRVLLATQRQFEASQALAFAEVYQRRSMNMKSMEYISESLGEFLYSEKIENSFYRHVVFRVMFQFSGVFKVVVAYCDFDIHSKNLADLDMTEFYEGFLIPLPDFDVGQLEDEERPEVTRGTITFWVKLFRPELKGDAHRGYADGEIKLEFGQNPFAGSHEISIRLDAPNTTVSPSGLKAIADKRFSAPKPTASPTLLNDQSESEFLEIIFDRCYKGYLF